MPDNLRAIWTAVWMAVRDALSWAPDWLFAVAILVLAGVAALIVHAIAFTALRRAIGERDTFLLTLLLRTRNLTRFALIAFALSAASQLAPLGPGVAAALTNTLVIAFVILAGWIAHVAVAISSDLYLRGFRAEAADNLLARKHVTQVRILQRAANTLVVLLTLSAALMTFDTVRQYGISLFASAGAAGLVVGLAARPVLGNLIAGIQIAITQPMRLGDQVTVENEFGTVEEITSTYVVLRLWDLRRMIVPLGHFIEKPFQNWTRESGALIGAVTIRADYTVPVEQVRARLSEIVKDSPLWDGRVVGLQVTDADHNTVELRAIAGARSTSAAWDLRCLVREKLIDYLAREHPDALPHRRQEAVGATPAAASEADATRPQLSQRR
jgi:small-conductance mechanosensitive channel